MRNLCLTTASLWEFRVGKKYFSDAQNNLILTGHSLGGAIACLVALMDFPIPSTIFNAPGCGHMPGIHNVDARYDVISKIGLVLGSVQLLEVPQDA